jgi:hypothetical protein
VLGALVPYNPDQPCAARAGQRKDGQEIGFVEVDMQIAVERRAGSFDVCDVKDLLIGATEKPVPLVYAPVSGYRRSRRCSLLRSA